MMLMAEAVGTMRFIEKPAEVSRSDIVLRCARVPPRIDQHQEIEQLGVSRRVAAWERMH